MSLGLYISITKDRELENQHLTGLLIHLSALYSTFLENIKPAI